MAEVERLHEVHLQSGIVAEITAEADISSSTSCLLDVRTGMWHRPMLAADGYQFMGKNVVILAA